jgi:hypothetical protein
VFSLEGERGRERRKYDEQRTDLYVEVVCGDLGVDDVLFVFPTHARVSGAHCNRNTLVCNFQGTNDCGV